MAYYIDEIKNTAVKADGKMIYGWNRESRMFDMPIADPTPKSRMFRCSEFEARRYLFEQDPRDCYERIVALSNKIRQIPHSADGNASTIETAEAHMKYVNEFKEEVSSEILALRAAVDEYGMEMSDAGQCLSNCVLLLENHIVLALNAVELARCKAEIGKCKNGQCEECPYAQGCDSKKEKEGK